MTAQTPATAELEKWLRVGFFTNFWLGVPIWVQRKNAESCWSRLQLAGSGPTSDLCIFVHQMPRDSLQWSHGFRQFCPTCIRTKCAYWVLFAAFCSRPIAAFSIIVVVLENAWKALVWTLWLTILFIVLLWNHEHKVRAREINIS